jgi:SNF2 family DNA or RNA helicase
MGLGKTIQTIAFIQSEVEENESKQPSLVVCPTSLVYNWKDEIEKFAPSLSFIIISGNKSQRDQQKQNIEDAEEDIKTKGFNQSKFKVLSILTRLRQICCDPSTFIENYKGVVAKWSLR